MKCKKKIQEVTRTYNWLQNKGLDLSRFKIENIIIDETVPTPSFKSRAEQIKNEYNHRFNIKRDIDAGILSLYERVNRLIFERV